MKKLLSIILGITMLFSLTACGENSDPATGNQQDIQNEQKDEPIVNLNPIRSELFDEEGNKLADISYEYDANGNRLSNTTTWVESWGGESETDSYDYDANGKMTAKHSSYGSSDYVYTIKYEYNPDGTIAKTYPADDPERINQYDYDADGKLSAIRTMYQGEENYRQDYRYDAALNAQIMTEDWGDGFVFTYTTYYNDDGTIDKWEYENGGKILRQHLYEYNDKGQLVKEGVSIESWKMEGYVVHHFE